jgi:CDGSH iron-sulfur domain-containing protein 3
VIIKRKGFEGCFFSVLSLLHRPERKIVMPEPVIAQKSPFVQKAEPGTFWWCACGRSKSQPFCDGSHKGTGFTPKKADIPEAKTVAWCGCKHSKNAPFCDGSHSRLA